MKRLSLLFVCIASLLFVIACNETIIKPADDPVIEPVQLSATVTVESSTPGAYGYYYLFDPYVWIDPLTPFPVLPTTLELEPGRYAFTLMAEGYKKVELFPTFKSGEAYTLRVVLQPE
jgi:hypothetical protein